jgi:small subunit ribosomal protein S1
MVANRMTRPEDECQQPMDEAWWEALLAEEEKYCLPTNQRNKQETLLEKKVDSNLFFKQPVVDWIYVQRLYDLDETIELAVSNYNRGGLLVDGSQIHGFVPVSHLVEVPCEINDTDREIVLANYVGRSISLKVIECDEERGRVVFSERAALAQAGRRNQLLEELKVDTCVKGVVTNITDFGVFVDLGGVEGLIHVSEISWGRVNHPTEIVHVGQQVNAYILQIDRDRSRIALSLKRLCDNPWETVEERYYPGQLVDATVTSVVPFGAFARLEEGLDGLIHITEMGLIEGQTPVDFLHEGQRVKAKILHIDPLKQRLGLSLSLEEASVSH